MHRDAEAEQLLREALAVRSPPYPRDDLRTIEVKVALANALEAQRRGREARALRAEIEAPLRASRSPYAADLRARLEVHDATKLASRSATMAR